MSPSPRLSTFSTFKTAFDRFDNSLNGGEGYSNEDNLDGTLAWKESYIMMSYLAMYRATNDVDYLKRLVLHAENVIAQRDDNQGRVDYRGVSGPTWVATKFSNNDEPYAWIVHSGMITYPMADFVQLVINNPNLWNYTSYSGQEFIEVANWLKDEVAQTIAAHDDQWDDAEGVYRFRDAPVFSYPNEILPVNQQAAMGRTLLMMYLATGEPAHLYKTSKLALHFYNNLTLDSTNDSYVWSYWSGINDSKEDLSHAAIEVDFALLCYEHDIMFSATDMNRFASTFKNNIYIEPLQFASKVDGSGEVNRYIDQTGRWLHLSSFDRDIYHIVADVFMDKVLYATTEWSGSTFLAIANLQLFQRLFDPIAVNRDSDPTSEFAGVATGDFDGDGIDEIITVRNLDGDFYMYKLNNDHIEIVASDTSPGSASQWAGIAAGDFDGDGKDEFVAVRNFDGGFYIYKLDNGKIKMVASDTSPGSASQWAGIAAGDFDEDGKDEFVAVSNFDGGFYMYKLDDGQIKNIASNTSPEPNSQWMGITAGDFDGDGTHELMANRNSDGDSYIYHLEDNGQIKFKNREFFPKDLETGILAAGKVQTTSQGNDNLIMLRNFDAGIFIFGVEVRGFFFQFFLPVILAQHRLYVCLTVRTLPPSRCRRPCQRYPSR